MANWLFDRLIETKYQAKTHFAFNGTINWMRALAETVNSGSCDDSTLEKLYSGTVRREVDRDSDTHVFENILLAFHNLSALSSINLDIEEKYDTCRLAIDAWYYCINFSSKAMLAAHSGILPKKELKVSNLWYENFVSKKLIPHPFNIQLSSLVTKTVDAEVAQLRNGNSYDLNTYPQDEEEAYGALLSYLNGTAGYMKDKMELKIKKMPEFIDLDVVNFRKKVAQELRDEKLNMHSVNFLTQVIRYRGKANNRDSIFLSYGENNVSALDQFTQDLLDVATRFLRISAFYASSRVEKNTWDEFIADLESNSRLSLDISILKVT
ncbi:MAG: hypothetical protein HRT52_02980 [Colwellia sp.]|nr:hypothetical protein [Colwellia sp.]